MAENLLDAAKHFVPIIRANLERIDSDRQLPERLAMDMAKKGLFGLYVPKVLGGPESDPITAFHVVEEISQADGSTGWCSFNGTALTSSVSRISIQAAKELFGDPPDIRGSGSARSGGTAKVAEGGYIVTGRWNYLSGVDHAKCLFLNCDMIDGNGPVLAEDGSQVTRVAVVPVTSGVVHDVWTTMGMRGTASNDAEFSELFVPESHTYARMEPAVHQGPLYNPQTSILLSWTLAAANALGMARGAMDAFTDIATAGSTNSTTRLRDRSIIQTTVGECEAMIGAGRSYVLSAVGSMWESQVAKNPDLLDKAVHARLAITHAIRQSVNVVDKLFYAAGTGAIHQSNGLERFFRDLHVSGQHISGLHNNYELGGQVLLGATPTPSLYA
ncbi:MAG: acyl-CoA dehydrogenase family protein [Chloroflexi bacterium]|nr:acyl-CoA dehydrogenase family protein [Chloroflexota bacterium]MDA1272070.1 acyl-CoA dehydrogenase family protein [Chloroflexota bacterium]